MNYSLLTMKYYYLRFNLHLTENQNKKEQAIETEMRQQLSTVWFVLTTKLTQTSWSYEKLKRVLKN